MPGIITQTVEDYLYAILPSRSEVLNEMERQAKQRDIPIVGPAVGRLLLQLASLIQATRIFELGSAIGYSTLWWAIAVGDRGKVIYSDNSEQNAQEAREYADRAGLRNRIEFRVGDALDALSKETMPLDIIFNDVDKTLYPRVLPLATAKLRKGGLFVSDNVLWSGRVTQHPREQDENTRAIVDFNRQLYDSKQFFTTIMPLRDGVAIATKL